MIATATKTRRTPRLPAGSVIGTFSKGVYGALSINFGLSGGANCERSCIHHPESTAPDATEDCYAFRTENRADRQPQLAKLSRLESQPAYVTCAKALIELQHRTALGHRIPWLRFSTNGAVPKPKQARKDKLFRDNLRALCNWAVSQEIPLHFPVESYAKARFYRSIVGDLVCVRESAQSERRFLRATGAVSATAQTAPTWLERIENARALAAKRREVSGRGCIVCPAVTNSWLARMKSSPIQANENAKCGGCTRCADGLFDIVYPAH